MYSDAKPVDIEDAIKECDVKIFGNRTTSDKGGGIGVNGNLDIGTSDTVQDFFSVTVNKRWLDPDGKPLDATGLEELKNQISSVTVELFRRVVDENQGPEDNWELVDSRYIKPDATDYWYTHFPFYNLLKVLNGKPLEYRIVEKASLTGEWSELNGGIIEFKTPKPINADNADDVILVDGKLPAKTTVDIDVDLVWTKLQADGKVDPDGLTPSDWANITKIAVELVRLDPKIDENGKVMVDKDGNILTKSVTVASKEQSPFPVPEENIADKNENTDTEIPGESLEKLNTRSVGTSFSWSAKAVLAL